MGSSQARALISTMLSGGKRARSPAPGLVLKAVQAFMKETSSPLRDDLARRIQSFCDLLVLHAGSSQENDLGANNFTIRGCVLSGSFNKNTFLIHGKRDNEGAHARHFAFLLLEVTIYRTFISRSSTKYVNVFTPWSTKTPLEGFNALGCPFAQVGNGTHFDLAVFSMAFAK